MKNNRIIFSSSLLQAVAEGKRPTSFLVRLRGNLPVDLRDGLTLECLFNLGEIRLCKLSGERSHILLRWVLETSRVDYVDLDAEIYLHKPGENS